MPYVAEARLIYDLLLNGAEEQTMDLTADHSPRFYDLWVSMAGRLMANPVDLACVAYSESGMRANASNDGPPGKAPSLQYHASGLIQFMEPTLRNVGWTYGYTAFRTLTADAQLPYMERYLSAYKSFLDSRALAYVATFVPSSLQAARDGGDNFVLVQKGGRLGWAYEANARAFDQNKDYRITVGELDAAIERNCRGPRWEAIMARLHKALGTEPPAPATDPGVADLGTTLGIQKALRRLGYDPGPVDGIPGPLTRAALVAFQEALELPRDAVAGPLTRAALTTSLALLQTGSTPPAAAG